MRDFPARLLKRLGFLASFGCSARLPAQPPVAHRHPVLLVHGILDSAISMRPIRLWLESRGWQVASLHLVPNNGSVPIEELARQVRAFVETTFPHQQKIDLVAFSMGGLVSRCYLQRLGGARRVARFVSISAPNHGTLTAYLSNGAGCREMRPGSPFLRELNGDLTPLSQLRYTSIWTPLDLMILPSTSSRMPIGTNIRKWVVAHPIMLFSPSVLRTVTAALSHA